MNNNFDWLEKKRLRSVKSLKLWPENPRLNPKDDYTTLKDYADEFMKDEAGDLKSFKNLVTSLSSKGFVPLDPIVVWKSEDNGKFYVAEGNRRVLALKLLIEPTKAPKWIRSFFLTESKKIDHVRIKKIPVYVAPSLEDAEWYISQRNNTSSLQRPWSRLQQFRWIEHLYNKYDGDVEKIKAKTAMSEADLTESIRSVKLLHLIQNEEVKRNMSQEAFQEAESHRFPLTIIERFFSNKQVKDSWGVDFEGTDLRIHADKQSFYNAFGSLVERIVGREKDENPINTRTITSNIEGILSSLPEVSLTPSSSEVSADEEADINGPEADETDEDEEEDTSTPAPNPEKLKKGDIHRERMVLSFYELHTGNYRLKKQFNELKEIPYRKYKSSIASSLRVFLDLAILEFIKTNQLENAISAKFNGQELKNIQLKKRLEYLKQDHLRSGTKAYKNVVKLMSTTEHYSLDALNGFVHSDDAHYISKEFLNGFWDFLFPLFQEILDINEN